MAKQKDDFLAIPNTIYDLLAGVGLFILCGYTKIVGTQAVILSDVREKFSAAGVDFVRGINSIVKFNHIDEGIVLSPFTDIDDIYKKRKYLQHCNFAKPMAVCDAVLGMAATALIVYVAHYNSKVPIVTIAIAAYAVVSIILSLLENKTPEEREIETIEQHDQTAMDLQEDENEGSATEAEVEHEILLHKPALAVKGLISREFSSIIRYALAQVVMLGTISNFRTIWMSCKVANALGLDLINGTKIAIDTKGHLASDLTQFNLEPKACALSGVISIILASGLGAMCTTTITELTEMIGQRKLQTDRKLETKNNVTEFVRATVTQAIKLYSPHLAQGPLMKQFGGYAGYFFSYLFEKMTSLYSVHEWINEKYDNPEERRKVFREFLLNALFEASVYGSFGMMAYSYMPDYAFKMDTFGFSTISNILLLGLIDAVVRVVILPSLSKKIVNRDEHGNATNKEYYLSGWKRLDTSASFFVLSAVFAFAISTSSSYNLMPFVFFMGCYPVLAKWLAEWRKKMLTENKQKGMDGLSIRQDFALKIPDIFMGCMVMGASFNLLLQPNGPCAVFTQLVKNSASTNAFCAGLSNFMDDYFDLVGVGFVENCARTFCLSFALSGIGMLAYRMYGGYYNDKSGADNSIMYRSIIRLPGEFLKYSTRFFFGVSDPKAHVITGMIRGLTSFIEDIMKMESYLVDHSKKYKEQPLVLGLGIICFIGAKVAKFVFDQLTYFAIDVMASTFLPDLLCMKGFVLDMAVAVLSAVMAEYIEDLIFDLIRDKTVEGMAQLDNFLSKRNDGEMKLLLH